MLKRHIKQAIYELSHILNLTLLRIKHVKYGKDFFTKGLIHVYGAGRIEIGDNVRINSCRRANPIGGDESTILNTMDSGKIVIGNNVGISNTSIIARKSIYIGDNVLIGGNCKFYDNDFHPVIYQDRLCNPLDTVSKSIVIKEGAFIGAHSIILKGVTVGKRSVIGAGSVVACDIPEDEIWAGNPVRFIKKINNEVDSDNQ